MLHPLLLHNQHVLEVKGKDSYSDLTLDRKYPIRIENE